jgi:hypothetical protein
MHILRIRGLLLSALAVILLAACCTFPAVSQVIDLDAQRLHITPISEKWRFHPGDDPHWAQPDFDDSNWKLFQPENDWVEQGYAARQQLAWFRFQLRVPAHTSSLVLEMPEIPRSYQLYADGLLVAQVGSLPPARPRVVIPASRLFTLHAGSGDSPRVITLALRLWQTPQLVGIAQNSLQETAYAGDAAAVLPYFSLIKSAALLTSGSGFIQLILGLIMAAAGLLLYLLTRQGFYAWFAANMVLSVADLPVLLLSHHFGWDYLLTLCGYILLDFLGTLSFALFVLGMLNRRSRAVTLWIVLLSLALQAGPLLLIFARLPAVWADGLYFFFAAAVDLFLMGWLIHGWRTGSVDARLLLIPFALRALFFDSGNLGYYLLDLGWSGAKRLVTADILLLRDPFSVTLASVGTIVSLLGLLAVLVYHFARTSREQQRLASALQAAHDIQQRLVPVDIPTLGGLRTEIVYLAAEEVGGDFCQVLPRADGSILVAIGDVSGKGLQAAMLGTLAVGALRAMADEGVGPAAALERINDVILRTGNEGFITCLCLRLSPAGVVTLANAGHLAPYLDGVELLVDSGLPLGILRGVEYEQSTFVLPEHARLTLLSDGVVEARSRTGELFGFERTSNISQLTASEIARAAQRFGQEDDITIVTLDWRLPVAELLRA